MLNNRELLFQVVADGHVYKVFTNGEVAGFGDAIVVNYFDLCAVRAHQGREHRHAQEKRALEAEREDWALAATLSVAEAIKVGAETAYYVAMLAFMNGVLAMLVIAEIAGRTA